MVFGPFIRKGKRHGRVPTFIFCEMYLLSLLSSSHIFLPMKYFGSILDFTRERNADLMRVYRNKLAEASTIVMPVIFALVAESPASRFWVSEERAAIVISAMAAGKPMPRMRSSKREMFEEIYRRYVALRERHPDRSVYELVTTIVNQPAPKFYLTPRTVGEFIYRIKNGWYDKQFDRYRRCSAASGE